jgi:hypothetical protein
VSDLVTTARQARESLARGLSALQSDPNVPAHLLELAAPIAQAMGALHQIERQGGPPFLPHAEVALNHVRTALQALQAPHASQASQTPAAQAAVAAALEAVAGSLGLVHTLAKQASNPPPAPQAAFPQAGAAQAHAGRPAPGPSAPAAPAAQAAAARPGAAAPAAAPSAPGGVIPAPAPGEGPLVEAALGTQSPTNFYKGLSGNDIIDHGGLFVSTYKIPKIGTSIRLRVSLPGGYEFEANAVVRWCRDTDGGHEAPPGFGAQFTQIAPEARQLVYRYVRNREPLFHDDL